MLFSSLMKHTVRTGAIRIVDAKGNARVYGDGSPPSCTLRFRKAGLEESLVLNPALRVPEAYMEGDLVVEDGTLHDFIELAARNHGHVEDFPLARALRWIGIGSRRIRQHNPIGVARKNVSHHYDLSDELYARFLDRDRQYSCAYFTDRGEDIDAAQANKRRHLASKLLLDRKGLRVLDIGSGWGGLGLYIAGLGDADVTGVTLSREQHKVSNERARAAGLADRVRFELEDYRNLDGRFDRIVSVGMFEHVGKRNYRECFEKLRDLLADDGVALLHSIGRLDTPAPINPFIRKYIFPGADLPALSEVTPVVERTGLMCTDIELLRLHYAETLRRWHNAFAARRDEIAKIYDERFCRMWEIYLVICEMGFRYENLVVLQMQFSKRLETVPITRDYMFEWERAQAERERSAEKDLAA